MRGAAASGLTDAPGRYLMEPRVFARMVQLADISDGDLVLDIGCGDGMITYQIGKRKYFVYIY